MITIGNTGVGKSSIIQLLSGKKVRVSSGGERGTSQVTTIESAYDENLCFIDTIGLQDGNQDKDWTDENLLKDTLKYIHAEGFRKIKVLFCVAGDTNTRLGIFAKPAEFIGNLKVDDRVKKGRYQRSSSSIWNSVLVIKKNGDGSLKDVSGVFDAAVKYGASNSFRNAEHVFGFKCVDWIDTEEDLMFKHVPKTEHEELNNIYNESVF